MKTLKNVLIVVAVFTFSISFGIYLNMDKHYCNWEDCGYQNEVMDQWLFMSESGSDEFTDTWCIEMTHFLNPEMTYEECEQYVFEGVE